MTEPEFNYYPIDLLSPNSNGNLVAGAGGTVMAGGAMQSPNFSLGSSGWIIRADGSVEFGSGKFRGDITGATGTFTGTITATTGTIGGFSIGSDYIKDAADSFGMASTVTGGDDVRFWAGATFANRATAPFRMTEAGAGTASNFTLTGGSISGTPISGIPNSTSTDISLLDATHDLVFSVTDKDTVAWASGTITMSNGRTFSITASNTGNMAARTYIYLDTGVSSTALQTTTTVSTAMGANKKLIAVAQNGSAQAQFTVYGGIGGIKLPASGTSISNNNWTYSGIWSVTDADTIAWGAGTLTTSDGGSYSISGSNTGNMAAKTYIYFDLGTSYTAFQTTTTAATAIGDGKILIAIAQNGTGEANFMVMNDKQVNIDAANIVAGSITANEIAASTITAAKMSVSQLSAISADMGAITAGTIVMPSGGLIRAGQTAYNTGTGFYLGNDSGTPKFSIGNPAARYLTWDGTTLTVNGYAVAPTSAKTMIPKCLVPTETFGTKDLGTNTVMRVGLITIPYNITVNKISVVDSVHTTNGTVKFGMYSSDGQTKIFEVTTATITGTGVVTTSLSGATEILAGDYFLAGVSVGTTAINFTCYATANTNNSDLLNAGVTSEPIYEGTVTVTAGTMPSTFNPASDITSATNCTFLCRLDN